MKLIGCVLLLLVGTAAALPQADRTKSDREKMQGEWTFVSVKMRGGRGQHLVGRRTLKVSGDTFQIIKLSGEVEDTATFKLDPEKKPKEIDIVFEQQGKKLPLMPGIYTIDGDRLQIFWCAGEAAVRPTDFEKYGGKDDVRGFVYERKTK